MCLFICSCSYKDNREDYNFLEDNSIRFIKNDTGIILLINKNDIFYKVILNDIDDIYYDYVIDNSGTLEELKLNGIKFLNTIGFNL